MNRQVVTKKSTHVAAGELSETSKLLSMAINGQIPAAALEKMQLDRAEVKIIVARELMFWQSALRGAKMELTALLFDELHAALRDNATR